MKRIIHHTKKAGKHVAKKSLHFTFPWMIHYLTDDYKDRHHHVVVDSILASILVVFLLVNIGLGYWFYLFFTPSNFNVDIQTPNQTISGHDYNFKVKYENPSRNLDNVEIVLEYPDSFIYSSSTLPPQEGTNNIFIFNDVPRNTKGEFEIKGKLLGDIGSRQRILAVADYDFHGFNQSESFFTTYNIQNSTLETIVEMPDKILNDEQFDIKIKYKNSSPDQKEQVKIALEIPDDLEIIPPEDQEYLAETKELVINEISAWEEGEAILSARFSAIGGEVSQTVKVVSLLSDGQESFVQTEEVKTINVLTPRLQTSSQINNTAYAIANFEDNIRFSAIVKNIGDVPLRDIAVTGNLSGEEVYWDQTTNSNLIALEPGQQTILTVDRRVAANVRPQNYSMSWQTQATAQIDDLDVTTYSQSSSSQVVFNSDLTFEADAEYYGNDGEQIGYGPYPLKAGETTAIRVFWKVSNFSNNLSNVTIQSQLPSQVEWTNFTSVSEGSAITYDPSTRKVTWHVSNLEANTHPQGANFELRITPNFQQVGQYINITHDSTLSALDSYTRQVLYRFQGPARLEKPVIE